MKYVEYEIGGRHLRLLLSVYATKKISERYGAFEDFGKKIADLEPMEQLGAMIEVIAILAGAGKKNAELMGEECDTITAEELEVLLPMDLETMAELSDRIAEAFKTGSKPTIEIKDDPKNA